MEYNKDTKNWEGECKIISCSKKTSKKFKKAQWYGNYAPGVRLTDQEDWRTRLYGSPDDQSSITKEDRDNGLMRNDYCMAAEGNDHKQGYIMECTIPKEMHGKCTVGMMDWTREWGGCLDLMVHEPGVRFQKVIPSTAMINVGSFWLKDAQIVVNRPAAEGACCPLTAGEFRVEQQAGVDEQLRVTIRDVFGKCPGFCDRYGKSKNCLGVGGCGWVDGQCVECADYDHDSKTCLQKRQCAAWGEDG